MQVKEQQYIVEYLLQHAADTPDATAFIFPGTNGGHDEVLTFFELAQRVKSVAMYLSKGNFSGNAFLLMYDHIPDFIVAFLACQYTGIVAVPVPFVRGSRKMDRLQQIISDVAAAGILCSLNDAERVRKFLTSFSDQQQIRIIATDENGSYGKEDIALTPDYHPISFIQYTSGSTAQPKGVVISAENLVHNQQLLTATFRCDTSSVIFSWLPFHHDMGLIGNILHTVYTGCSCVLTTPATFIQSPVTWLHGITKYKATHSGGPNFAYDLCVDRVGEYELQGLDLSSWRVAFNGSEQVRADTIDRFAGYFTSAGFSKSSFYPCYGLAEATLLVAGCKEKAAPIYLDVTRHAEDSRIVVNEPGQAIDSCRLISAGKISAGMQLRIISTTSHTVCNELQEGEICIAGKSITAGYWNRDNSPFFYDIDGVRFLRTGDRGFLYRDQLFVSGRIKEMMIVRGANIYPYDIEALVAEKVPAVEANGVVVFSVGELSQEIVLIAEIRRKYLKDINSAGVIAAIEGWVQGQFGIVPYDIVLVSSFTIPRTTSGKLQRVLCRERYSQNSLTHIAAKRDLPVITSMSTESHLSIPVLNDNGPAVIRNYVTKLIQHKTGIALPAIIDDRSDITALGLDSLRSIELINTLNKELDINIDPAMLYQHHTFGSLINIIENLLWLKTEYKNDNVITL